MFSLSTNDVAVINVAVVEPNPVVRRLLKFLLSSSSNIKLTTEVDQTKHFLDSCSQTAIDIVLCGGGRSDSLQDELTLLARQVPQAKLGQSRLGQPSIKMPVCKGKYAEAHSRSWANLQPALAGFPY